MYANVCGFLRLRVIPKTVAATSPPSASWRCSVSPPCAWVTSLPASRWRLTAAAESRLARSSSSVRAPGLSARGSSPTSARAVNLQPRPPPPPRQLGASVGVAQIRGGMGALALVAEPGDRDLGAPGPGAEQAARLPLAPGPAVGRPG